MSAVITKLADALVAELNTSSTSFELPFTAVRRYLPFDVADMERLDADTVYVSVIPRSWSIEAMSRAADAHDYEVDLGIQKRVDANDTDQCDAVMHLAEEIVLFFNDRSRNQLTLQGDQLAHRVGVVPDPIWIHPHLYKANVFTCVVTATYRVM